jgi:hypothetical protein
MNTKDSTNTMEKCAPSALKTAGSRRNVVLKRVAQPEEHRHGDK